jgi:hypothetical protein
MKVNKNNKMKHNIKNKNVSVVSNFPGNRENAKLENVKEIKKVGVEVKEVDNEKVKVNGEILNNDELAKIEMKETEGVPVKAKKELSEAEREQIEKAKDGFFLLEKINVMIELIKKRRDNQKCKGKIRKNGERVFCHTVWYSNKIKQLEEDRDNGEKKDGYIKIRPLRVSGFYNGVEVPQNKSELEAKALLKEVNKEQVKN